MTYTFPTWIPLTAWVIAALALCFGFLLRRRPIALLVGLFVAAISGALVAPMLWLDRVVINDEKLEQTTGFWWSPTVKGFRIAEVSHVLITTSRDRRNRFSEIWVVTFKDGRTQDIDPGDLWEMNGDDITQRLRAFGIEVTH